MFAVIIQKKQLINIIIGRNKQLDELNMESYKNNDT